MEKLQALREGRTVGEEVILPVTLVVRGSTRDTEISILHKSNILFFSKVTRLTFASRTIRSLQ